MTKKLKIRIIIIILISTTMYYFHLFLNQQNEHYLIKNYLENKETNIEDNNNNNSENYLGILSIPKINLEKGFYNINNKKNNVNKNIQVLKNSSFPNESSGILAIASHSGNGKNAYFKNLHKLKLQDEIYINLNNIIYTYKIINIYETSKNGKINISKEYNNCLVLTTCSSKKNKQLVIIAQLITKKASIEAF